MDLVVLNVAYPFAPVGPDAPGGSEFIVTQLDAALTRAGHESFVMACEGSVTEGILLATPKPSEVSDAAERHRIHEQYRFTLQTFLEKWPIDLIHMHGADFFEYLPPPGVPVLITLHLPADQYPESIFHLDRPQTFLQCVSGRQRAAFPPCANLLPDCEGILAAEPANVLHTARSPAGEVRFETAGGQLSNAGMIEKFFPLYEQIVGQSRALETSVVGYGAAQFEAESVRA